MIYCYYSGGSSKYLPDFEDTEEINVQNVKRNTTKKSSNNSDATNNNKNNKYSTSAQKQKQNHRNEYLEEERREISAGYGPPSPLRVYRGINAEDKEGKNTPTYRAMTTVSSSSITNDKPMIRPHSEFH